MDAAGPSRHRQASVDKMMHSYHRSSAYADDASSPTAYTDDDSAYYRHGSRSGSEAAQSTKASSPVDRMSPYPSVHGEAGEVVESPSSARPPFSLYDLPDPSTFKEPGLSFMTTSTAESASGRNSDYLAEFGDEGTGGQQGAPVRIRQASGGTPVESESDILEGYQDLTLGRSGNVLARRATGGETGRSRMLAEKANIRGLAPAPYAGYSATSPPISPPMPASARPSLSTQGSYQQALAERHLQRSRRDISGPTASGDPTSPRSPEAPSSPSHRMRSNTVSTTASSTSLVSISASSDAERSQPGLPRSQSQDVYQRDSHRQPSWLNHDPAGSEHSYGRASTPSVSGSQPTSRSNSLRYSRKHAHRMDVYNGYQTVDESFTSDAEANAVMLVEDGRSSIVDMERIARWGGVDSLRKRLESEIGGDIDGGVIEDFSGATHVLLPALSLSDDTYGLLSALLPIIASTLVVLDVSNCLLDTVPEALVRCKSLEELNISENPLASLPGWLGQLPNLRVLVVDACGLKTLPSDLVAAHHLHTICARRNRLISLPSWLSQLPRLRTLLVDENPFAGQWKDLVKNIASASSATASAAAIQQASRYSPEVQAQQTLDKDSTSGFATPAYTASGPPSVESLASQLEADEARQYDNASASASAYGSMSNSAGATRRGLAQNAPAERMATPNHFVPLAVSPSASSTFQTDRTASMFTDTTETPGLSSASRAPSRLESSRMDGTEGESGTKVVRRMRSAGNLFGFRNTSTPEPNMVPASHSAAADDDDLEPPQPRFATFNGRTRSRAGTSMSNYSQFGHSVDAEQSRSSSSAGNYQQRSISGSAIPAPPAQNKTGKWGFLKKMSMSRMRANGVGNSHVARPSGPPHSKSDSAGNPDTALSVRPGLTHPAHSTPAVPTLSSGAGGPIAQRDKAYGPIGRAEHPGRQQLRLQNNLPTVQASPPHPSQQTRAKRQSFLPIWDGAPALNIAIPSTSPFMASTAVLSSDNGQEAPDRDGQISSTGEEVLHETSSPDRPLPALPASGVPYDVGLRSIMSYLRDLYDLSLPIPTAIGGAEVVASEGPATASISGGSDMRAESPSPAVGGASRYNTIVGGRRSRRPTGVSESTTDSQRRPSEQAQGLDESQSSSVAPSISGSASRPSSLPKEVDEDGVPAGKKYKDDAGKRAGVIRHIVETERTYVQGLKELVDIYVSPSSVVISSKTGETLIPASERKIVFGGIEGILRFHQTSFLPDLERAAKALLTHGDDVNGEVSKTAANSVGQVFRLYNPFMRQYSAYINNFDFALQRLRNWTSHSHTTHGASSPTSATGSPTVMGTQGIQTSLVGVGLGMSAMTPPPTPDGVSSLLSSTQRKRVRTFLQTCRQHPRHSQINLESYLLLPVQRIPRYRLLLEDLARSTPPIEGNANDVIEDALQEMTALASSMNEEKRDSESRRRLVKWQSRIRGKFATPLVQAHRRLLLDGHLTLSRVVKRANVFVEVSSHVLPGSTPSSAPGSPFGSSRQLYGESSDPEHTITSQKAIVQIEALTPEISNRKVAVILTSDLLILCKDVIPSSPSGLEQSAFTLAPAPGEGPVDLYAVLRLQTKKRPASLVRGNEIRLVDNKSILYFTAGSNKEAVDWVRTINTEFDPMR